MGRPLADRSVIYKYLNPNLIAVLSESIDDNVDRSSLLLHVIDAVTGQVCGSCLLQNISVTWLLKYDFEKKHLVLFSIYVFEILRFESQ